MLIGFEDIFAWNLLYVGQCIYRGSFVPLKTSFCCLFILT